MKKPKVLPTYSRGPGARVVLWSTIPGFVKWFRAAAPGLTDAELIQQIESRFHVPNVTSGNIIHLRRQYHGNQTPETIQRAYENRQNYTPKKPPVHVSPEEKLDRTMLQQQIQRLTKRQTFFELVGEKILAAISEIPSLPPVRPPKIKVARQLDEEEHVLFISDVQAGLTLGGQESGGLATFNSQILVDEINFYGNTIVAMKPYQPNARKVNIFFGGDLVENEVIFPGQTREIDQNVMNQVLLVTEHFVRLLYKLLHVYDEIECWVVIGNHGRIGGKPGEHDPMSNWDWLAGKMMQERTKDIGRIKWNIPDTWWALPNILGFNYLLVHGDDVGGGYAGIPFYGSERSRTRFQDMFTARARMQGDDAPPIIHRMCIGHFSEPAAFYTTIMNGSWPGGTIFSVKRLQRSAIPSQKMWAVHPRWGTTWMRDIVLRPLP